MEKISWTLRVGREELLHRVKEEMNILLTIKRRKTNWIGHTLPRNCLMTLRKREGTGNCKKKNLIDSVENSLWKRL
jgi:hypothetical protein